MDGAIDDGDDCVWMFWVTFVLIQGVTNNMVAAIMTRCQIMTFAT